jgi:hypothetical protein
MELTAEMGEMTRASSELELPELSEVALGGVTGRRGSRRSRKPPSSESMLKAAKSLPAGLRH